MAEGWLRADRNDIRSRGWSFILWGVVIAAFGVAVLLWPQLSASVLVTLAGLAILGVGLVLSYGAWRLREVAGRLWVAALVPALAVAVFGLVVVLFPAGVTDLLLAVVALLALLGGFWDVVSGVASLTVFRWGWLRVLRGVVLAALAIWVFVTPMPGLVTLGWLVGAVAVLLGVLSAATGAFALGG